MTHSFDIRYSGLNIDLGNEWGPRCNHTREKKRKKGQKKFPKNGGQFRGVDISRDKSICDGP